MDKILYVVGKSDMPYSYYLPYRVSKSTRLSNRGSPTLKNNYHKAYLIIYIPCIKDVINSTKCTYNTVILALSVSMFEILSAHPKFLCTYRHYL